MNTPLPSVLKPKASFDDHPCLSALSSCSGLSPCDPCREALARWVMPKALLAAECASATQVSAFLDAYGVARRGLIASIREAAVAHEAQVARVREAFDTTPPPPPSAKPPMPPMPPISEAAAAVKAQVESVPKIKKTKKAVLAEAEATINELFAEAVKPSAAPAVETNGTKKAKG